jgi:hypothetical protein
MKWLVAVCCANRSFLNDPLRFLAEPSTRTQPRWACGLVTAANREEAFDAGIDAWDAGLLSGQTPGDELINWYVAELPSGIGTSALAARTNGKTGSGGFIDGPAQHCGRSEGAPANEPIGSSAWRA